MGIPFYTLLTFSYNAISNEPITFQELYMHNADGDMETLLDIYGHGGKEVLVSYIHHL